MKGASGASIQVKNKNQQQQQQMSRRLHRQPIITLFFLVAVFLGCHLAGANHAFVYAVCSKEKYQDNSPFESNLNTFLSDLASSSSQSLYNSFAVGNDTSSSSSPDDGDVYGLYQCRGDLQGTDCARCVENVASQIGLVCPDTFGASFQLDECLVRYESVDFLGKVDKTIWYKKCGSRSVGNDADFFRRRDDVLDDLQGAAGFRVSSSGLVQGFAQCLGDLSPADCSDCLSDAVSKLKSLCGSAQAADMFLGQCYARYWASGYYNSHSDSSKDDAGRTVAIIVGIMAGVAIMIVLLSVCRKATA